jgi:hypothetical protein
VLLAGSLVRAERPHVVILGPASDHAAVVRMRGELSMLGIDVDVLVQARDSGSLEAIARRLGASAVLRVELSPPAIVLWVDPAVSPIPPAEIRVGGAQEERDPALLALRAVEILRARLIEVPRSLGADAGDASPDGSPPDAATGPDASDAGAPAALPETVMLVLPERPREDRPVAGPAPVALSAAPGVLLSPGGVPAAFHVRVGAEWDPMPSLGVEAMAFLPATAGTVNAEEGSVNLRVFGLGGGLRGLVTDPAARFSVALGLGAAALLLTFSGKAAPPWMGDTGSRWAVAPYASITTGYRLHSRVSIRLDIVAALVRPEPVVRVAGQDAASFGQPAVIPSLGLEVRP